MRESKTLEGIQRLHDGINTDGGCDEIINVRKKDGQWILKHPKSLKYNLSSVTHIDDIILWYNHPVSAEGKFIGYDTNAAANQIKEIIASTGVANILLTLIAGEVCSKIYHFGNILIIVTDLDVYYLMYDYDTESYNLLPDLVHPTYTFCSNTDTKVISDTYTGIANAESSMNVSELNTVMTKIRQEASKLVEKGYINGHVVFRVALRLDNGDFINYSAPFYYFIGQHDTSTENPGTGYDPVSFEYDYWMGRYATIAFKFEDVSDFYNDLVEYGGIIKSVCVFMSKPLPDRDINRVYIDGDLDIDAGVILSVSIPDNIIPDNIFTDIASFYLVHEIPIDELDGVTTYTETIKPNLSTLETLEALTVNSHTNHKIYSDLLYEYNSRLHIASPTVKFGKGNNKPLPDWILIAYEKTQMIPLPVGAATISITANAVNDKLFEFQQIKTKLGYKNTFNDQSEIPLWIDDLANKYFTMNNILSYPDSRGSAIGFYYHKFTDDKYYLTYGQEIYKIHPFLNVASIEEKWVEVSSTIRLWQCRVLPFDENGVTGKTFDEIILYNDTEVNVNRIQVSQVSTPFYYPAENSYRVGRITNIINGLMSQAVPMSTGQYGNFPLMVFSSEGIFTLEQGSGEILYQSIQPVSLDVCNNPDSIIAINGGILFASQKGLMVLYGSKVDEISVIVEGLPKSDIKTDANYISSLDGTDSITSLSTAISANDFIEFITESIIAYDLLRDEILVCSTKESGGSPVYAYSYIFSVKEKLWYKTNQVFTSFIKDHPNWFAIDSQKMYNIDVEDTNDLVEFVIKTNPIRFNTNDYKTIERLVLRFTGSFYKSFGKNFALYLYGSLTGKEWKLISGIKPDHTQLEIEQTLLMLRKVRTTARYFVLYVASSAYELVISDVEFDLKLKIPKKLR